MKTILALAAAFPLAIATTAIAFDVADYRLVDLSHSYDENTVYWPANPPEGFQLKRLAYGETPGGYFYSSNSICTAEHGGTHLDAPIHFSAAGITNEKLPLEQLIAPGVRIDIRDKTQQDRSYRLTRADVVAFEKRSGRIQSGTIVLLQTGWSEHWPDRKAYLGDASLDDASHLDFPSYGEDAARLLVEERGVAMLGIDTASIDYGKSKDFIVHRVAAARNVGGLENLMNLDQLPVSGFTIVALPMKIAGGSGGPARVVAMVPK
jgi:kynurenine formamidase